jgi:hypothetical protein
MRFFKVTLIHGIEKRISTVNQIDNALGKSNLTYKQQNKQDLK